METKRGGAGKVQAPWLRTMGGSAGCKEEGRSTGFPRLDAVGGGWVRKVHYPGNILRMLMKREGISDRHRVLLS